MKVKAAISYEYGKPLVKRPNAKDNKIRISKYATSDQIRKEGINGEFQNRD